MPWQNHDTLTSANLNNKSGVAYNVKDVLYGAVGDGVTDDTAAIQAALDAATAAGGTAFFPMGVYLTTGTTSILCNVESDAEAWVYYNGTGTAVEIGDDVTILNRKRIVLPKVHLVTQVWTGAPLIGTDTGVSVRYLYASQVELPLVENFSLGFVLTGTHGVPYNRFFIGHLHNNAVNLSLRPSVAGWVNENQFHGGRYSHESAMGTGVVGTRHIEILLGAGTNRPNNNIWLGGSVEGNVNEYKVYCDGGRYNAFFWLRWEGSTPKVYYGTSAQYNMIIGGYASARIAYTSAGGSTRNDAMETGGRWNHSAGNAAGDGVVILRNTYSSTEPTVTLLESGTDPHSATIGNDYAWQFGAQDIDGKRSTDSYPRVNLDNVNGRVYLGSGSGAPADYLYYSSANSAMASNGTFMAAGLVATGRILGTGVVADNICAMNYNPSGVLLGTARAATVSPQILSSGDSSSADSIAAIGATVLDGTNNRRIGLWVDQTDDTVGLSWNYSVGAPTFYMRGSGTNLLAATASMTTFLTPISIASSAPASGLSTGCIGQLAFDEDYLYVCTSTNSWRQVALTAF